MARRGEPLGRLAGCPDELLDAWLDLPAPHAALPEHDLETPSARLASPPTTFHGDGKTMKSSKARRRNIAPFDDSCAGSSTHHPVRMIVCAVPL